jgi:hypothetical protein
MRLRCFPMHLCGACMAVYVLCNGMFLRMQSWVCGNLYHAGVLAGARSCQLMDVPHAQM